MSSVQRNMSGQCLCDGPTDTGGSVAVSRHWPVDVSWPLYSPHCGEELVRLGVLSLLPSELPLRITGGASGGRSECFSRREEGGCQSASS